jgi:hypothetical protein
MPTASAPDDSASKHATVTGLLLGTPVYMSPEQACGLPIDARADVWGLAVTAYQLLADDLPFDGASVHEILAEIASGRPMPLSYYRPDVPDALHDLFERAFSEDIDARFQTAADFAAAFEQAAAARRGTTTLVGLCPSPMSAISVPPPARPALAAPSPPPAPATESAHDVPAGMPRRGSPRRVAAAAAALLALGALVFARCPAAERAPPASAAAPLGRTAPPRAREGVDPPPPPEEPAIVAPTSVPELARAPTRAPIPRRELVAAEPAMLAAPTSSAAPAPPPPAPRRREFDRGEIF